VCLTFASGFNMDFYSQKDKVRYYIYQKKFLFFDQLIQSSFILECLNWFYQLFPYHVTCIMFSNVY